MTKTNHGQQVARATQITRINTKAIKETTDETDHHNVTITNGSNNLIG